MFKSLILIVKYPYTSGVIAILWSGVTMLYVIDNNLPIMDMITINMISTLLIAIIGFRKDS